METVNGYQISGAWTDLNTLTGIVIGQQITLHNAGRAGDIIEVAVSDIEPIVSFRGVAIKALAPQYRVAPQDFTVWVRYIRYDLNGTITPTAQHKCLLNVQEIADIEEVGAIPSTLLTTNDKTMRIKTSPDSSKTAFGDLKTESNSPVTQISAQYGLLQNVLTITDSLISGTNSVQDKKFTCETGTSIAGLASILTLRQISSRSGQGVLAIFPAVFGSPVDNNTQAAGLITAENSFVFGFIGTNFGIFSVRDGLDELQELTLTVAATGAETATVTINGIPHLVSLSGTGITDDAYEIATHLASVIPNYHFSSNGSTVVAQAVLPGPQGSFDYSSTGTSAGSWVQFEPGQEGITTFIPQAEWNVDTRLTGDVDSILNPLFNNDYQIQLNGAADFFVEDRNTKRMVLVHRMSFVNCSTDNNPANSTFRVGWITNNTGNNTNITIQGGKAGLFNEGEIYYDTIPLGQSNSQPIPAGAGLQTSVLILRNRLSFAGAVNRSEALPLIISGSTESNKFAEFKLLLDPVFSSPVNFSYIDKSSSIVEVSKDAVLVTGGREIGELIVEAGNPQLREFNQTTKTTTAVYPGATIAIVATLQAGGAADCQASVTLQEDL